MDGVRGLSDLRSTTFIVIRSCHSRVLDRRRKEILSVYGFPEHGRSPPSPSHNCRRTSLMFVTEGVEDTWVLDRGVPQRTIHGRLSDLVT